MINYDIIYVPKDTCESARKTRSSETRTLPGGICGDAHGPVFAEFIFLKLLLQLAIECQRAFYFGEGTHMLNLVRLTAQPHSRRTLPLDV